MSTESGMQDLNLSPDPINTVKHVLTMVLRRNFDDPISMRHKFVWADVFTMQKYKGLIHKS